MRIAHAGLHVQCDWRLNYDFLIVRRTIVSAFGTVPLSLVNASIIGAELSTVG